MHKELEIRTHVAYVFWDHGHDSGRLTRFVDTRHELFYKGIYTNGSTEALVRRS